MSYRRVDFDAVAPLMPFDKTASQVAGRGERFEWTPVPGKVHSAEPLALRPPNALELKSREFKNLTGTKIGRLTVQGIAADFTSVNGTNWSVRCVCGSYETRKAKFIKACMAGDNPGDHEPMCDSCSYTRKLQLGYHNPKKAAAAAEAIQEMAR